MKTYHFIVLLTVGLALVSPLRAGELAASEEDGFVRVTLDGDVFTEYHYAAADRAFFYPLIAPTGDNIARHWPMKKINPAVIVTYHTCAVVPCDLRRNCV